MESVSITEDDSVTNPSLEEQSEQQDKQEQNSSSERPEWLPEKFQSVEDMAKAYGELESKLGSSNTEETEELGETPEQNSAISAASAEWDEKGELSEGTYQSLAKSGISRDMVDLYIQGVQAQVNSEEADLKNLVGGDENYQRMAEWAQNTLTEQEQEEFDEVVTEGSPAAAKFAIQGLYARFSNESGGYAPLLSGSVADSPNSATFRSIAQVKEAMSDPRYANDPAYRNRVAERLRHSNIM
tara:strand:- start:3066 stop:3791 length:726 start_codon:yes stop_codon:yes gene_type:complete